MDAKTYEFQGKQGSLTASFSYADAGDLLVLFSRTMLTTPVWWIGWPYQPG